LKKQNKILQENVKKAQQLTTENIMSGRAPAGAKEPTQEDKVVDEAKRIMKGSGYEDFIGAK